MNRFSRSTTARLTATYLGLIMVLSVGFSVALYKTSSHDIGRQLPPNSLYIDQFGQSPSGGFDNFFRNRISEGRHDVLAHLILLNILALVVGAGVSYYLARRTLQPIESSMAAQARFSSDASHELRTPLTAIRTRNEVALRKPKLALSEAKEVIKSNLNEVKKLETLSEGLLRLSHGDGKEIIRQPLLLGELANDAMNQFITPAQAKQISIEDSVPEIRVIGDAASLTQAIAILIDNAIKYGCEGDKIYLEGQQKAGYGYLSVRDTGPGMRASDVPHIFERFYRADNSRSREGDTGYGLGLSIAKQIVDQHDGEIVAISTIGHGSTFTIKLPLNLAG
jgi:two-component system sensor histidine kinase CiaH